MGIAHRIERAGRHELLIHAQFPPGTAELHLPVWRPGRYERGDFARLVRSMAQWDGAHWRPLRKSELHVWTCLDTKGTEGAAEAVHVRYRFTADRLDAGSTWTDDALLYVNPVNCLLFHPECEAVPVTVHLPDIPKGWRIATALLASEAPNGWQLHADGTQHLMDSPWIAAPEQDLHTDTYTVDGHPFHLHVWGKRHYAPEAFLETHRRFTAAQMAAFGWLPVPEYHFLYLFPDFDARHGVEHEASTVIAWGPAEALTNGPDGPSPGFEEVIDIASHELVHTWNVKWLRPAEWFPYDFKGPSPSRMGYIAEGVTTYLGDLFLLESGVIDMEGWLRRFEKLLTRHLWNPGRLETSVADSGFDTWLDGYSIGIPHRRGNIYVEGAVLAFLCDVTLHRAGGGWLIEALAELAGPDGERGLTEHRWWDTLLRRAAARGEEGVHEMAGLREDHCDGVEDTWPAIVDALLHQGVQAILEPHVDPLARCGALGVTANSGNKEIKVCWPDSPAWKAGLRRGDTVTSATENNGELALDWLRDGVHLEQDRISVPSGTGHFARPVLSTFPG